MASIIFITVDKVVEDLNIFLLSPISASWPLYSGRYGCSFMSVLQ